MTNRSAKGPLVALTSKCHVGGSLIQSLALGTPDCAASVVHAPSASTIVNADVFLARLTSYGAMPSFRDRSGLVQCSSGR